MSGSSEDGLRRQDEPLSTSERALRDRERELASVQQIVRVAGITVDLRDGFSNGKRTPEYLAIHGLPPDAVDTHTDWVARLHPEDRDRIAQAVHRAFQPESGGHYAEEYRTRDPEPGGDHWVSAWGRVLCAGTFNLLWGADSASLRRPPHAPEDDAQSTIARLRRNNHPVRPPGRPARSRDLPGALRR